MCVGGFPFQRSQRSPLVSHYLNAHRSIGRWMTRHGLSVVFYFAFSLCTSFGMTPDKHVWEKLKQQRRRTTTEQNRTMECVCADRSTDKRCLFGRICTSFFFNTLNWINMASWSRAKSYFTHTNIHKQFGSLVGMQRGMRMCAVLLT